MLNRLPVAAVLALGLTPPPVADLRFAPEEGLALSKSFQRTESSKLKSSRTVQNGQERDAGRREATELEVSCVFTDRYLGLDGARVTRLERSFADYERETRNRGTFGGQELESTGRATNALAGLTVRFETAANAEGYVKSCAEAESEQLANLELDRDYRALLPEGPVKLRTKWSIAAEDFRPLLDFDADLPLEWARFQDGQPIEVPMLEREGSPEVEHAGEVTARFDRLRKVKGRQLAVVSLEGEIETVWRSESESGGVQFTSRRAETLELEGEYLWDVGGGHLHSLSVEADLTVDERSDERIVTPDRTYDTTQETLRTGKIVVEAEFERVDG